MNSYDFQTILLPLIIVSNILFYLNCMSRSECKGKLHDDVRVWIKQDDLLLQLKKVQEKFG